MSKFNRPRSHPLPSQKPNLNRPRIYPYYLGYVALSITVDECEACGRNAKHDVRYVPNPLSVTSSTIFLCDLHKDKARWGRWETIWRDMNEKLEEQNAGRF